MALETAAVHLARTAAVHEVADVVGVDAHPTRVPISLVWGHSE